ncbi:MAG: dTDP-4-dehydrorhamnose reductase [Pedobacter sp.]|jgi:dTDP-4-dehydrorhamnose reductase|nr:dTDP-4-dehydrorhamnose reductase [Pedobacter sp.]
MQVNNNGTVEVWGGLECTINRVGDNYFDQLEYSGHYERMSDLDLIASLGVKMLRYPVIWEKHQMKKGEQIDWTRTERYLNHLKNLGVTPIAGLVHHGSGPEYVNFYDGSFEEGLAVYAKTVAEKFPWLEFYTPVNEPLTTARFCGLYGHWFPHKKSDYDFFKVLLSECKATVMAMKAIREVNPRAKLIQTDDLGKCHSTPLLAYQAEFENERRWLSYELLAGKLTPDKYMWRYMVGVGIDVSELSYFLDNNYAPDICGFNYYLTSERYLDEDTAKYPECYHGGNGNHTYADVHTAIVKLEHETGAYNLIKEAWERLQLPLAITECHLYSPREEQMRWFNDMWNTANRLKNEGVDIRAITAWALFGLHGWNKLCTQPFGEYEPGVFNLNSGVPRPTAMVAYLQALTRDQNYAHPVLETEGWWKLDVHKIHIGKQRPTTRIRKKTPACQPLIIIGKSGTLGVALSRIATDRNIHHKLLSREDLDITKRSGIEAVVAELNPWAIINAAGYVKVDEAENQLKDCLRANSEGPSNLAAICEKNNIKLLSFSSDLVFDGKKLSPYTESDAVSPLNNYGKSKVQAEKKILELNPNALIVRTSSFFGPWDEYNFATRTLKDLAENKRVRAASDVFISPTYLPDLAHECLNILLDDEYGIFHLTNYGAVSWAEFAFKIAEKAGYDRNLIEPVPFKKIGWKVLMPNYSALGSEKGIRLPSFEDALQRYVEALDDRYLIPRIAG